MKSKVLVVSILVLVVICGGLLYRIIDLKDKIENTTQFDIAKEKARQERLYLQNEIYTVRAEKEVLLKVLDVYEQSLITLEENDENLRKELGNRTEEIQDFSIDELENYFKDEFKDF